MATLHSQLQALHSQLQSKCMHAAGALFMPHACREGAFVCVEPWAGGRGGPPLHPLGWAAGQMSLPVIAGQRSPVPSLWAAHQRSGDRAVIAPLVASRPRCTWPGRRTFPASDRPPRSARSPRLPLPGKSLALRQQGILWLHHGRPKKIVSPTDFICLYVFRSTVGQKRSVTVEAKLVYPHVYPHVMQ
jgi:hypothetical protein